MKLVINIENWKHINDEQVIEQVKKALDKGVKDGYFGSDNDNFLNKEKGTYYLNDYENSGVEIQVMYNKKK